MPADEDRIRRCLERYGRAVSAGDLPAVSACWHVPALVLSDAQSQPVVDRAEIEAFLAKAIEWYRSQGLVETRPELERTVPLTDRLTAVDVRWPAFDEAGEEKVSERSHYIMRLGDDGNHRIQVALTMTAES